MPQRQKEITDSAVFFFLLSDRENWYNSVNEDGGKYGLVLKNICFKNKKADLSSNAVPANYWGWLWKSYFIFLCLSFPIRKVR